MILYARLKNFRKHRDTTLNFQGGLNVLRGPNESGKTTIIEGIAYALGGSKTLRDTLAETVTWGEKESSLRSEVGLRINGTTYHFARSKGGAEVRRDGEDKPFVTGQSEVTAFAAELLGCDMKTAGMLMMASQSDLRGALTDGPTAVSGLISKLANSELIDRLLERAGDRLSLGSELPVRERLAAAEADVQVCNEVLSGTQYEETLAELDRRTSALQAELATVNAEVQTLHDSMGEKNNAVQQAQYIHNEYEAQTRRIAEIEKVLVEDRQKLKLAEEEARVRPDAEKLASLRRQIMDGESHARLVQTYTAFAALPSYPAAYWEGTKAAYDAELQDLQVKLSTASARISEINRTIPTLETAKAGKCPTCGHDAAGDPHVAKRNAEIDEQIKKLTIEGANLKTEIDSLRDSIKAMQEVANSPYSAAWTKTFAKFAANVTVDENFFPPRAVWNGEIPVATVDVGALKRELGALELVQQRAEQASGRAAAYRSGIARNESDLATAKETAQGYLPLPELEPLKAAYDEAYHQYALKSQRSRDLSVQVTTVQHERQQVVQTHQSAEDRLKVAQAVVERAKEDLRVLAFNNQLVKDLRALKPVITDFLWNNVLAAVGTFFSMMRGETSKVTKDASGFKVNDRSVESLSGSTLDVLALAIRVALTKTFIPHVTFMSTDEPAHGCDTVRTSNVLGFLSSVGFDQVLLASHDELSEAVADNCVLLGE